MLLALLSFFLLSTPPTSSLNFVFPDFNRTGGLTLLGSAATTSCEVGIDLTREAGFIDLTGRADRHGETSGRADNFSDVTLGQQGEKYAMQSVASISTNVEGEENDSIERTISTIGHRDDYTKSKETRCGGRIRLTPSTPSKVGGFWHRNRLPIVKGFDTIFTFQISDHSKECTDHIDPSFSLRHHRTCAVHGGDGFAFVIHNSKNDTEVLGLDGDQLGFGGIDNSLAVKFDTWTNLESQGSSDLFTDHISIHSNGAGGMNSAGQSTKFGASRATPLADGDIHVARIQYLPYFEKDYLPVMSASENLIDYLKDNAEDKRLGTLAVFVDEGVETTTPILAIPINLSVLLNFDMDSGYAGFTASTGRRWEKHDILSWLWCENEDCDRDGMVEEFDYYQQSKFFNARHDHNVPGHGYGAGGLGLRRNEPIRHASPDTTPWTPPPSRSANGFVSEPSEKANLQLPPNTPS